MDKTIPHAVWSLFNFRIYLWSIHRSIWSVFVFLVFFNFIYNFQILNFGLRIDIIVEIRHPRFLLLSKCRDSKHLTIITIHPIKWSYFPMKSGSRTSVEITYYFQKYTLSIKYLFILFNNFSCTEVCFIK